MTDNHSDSENKRELSELVGESVRIYQRGNMWYATLQHEGRQHRQSLRTRSKKEARRRAIRLETKILDGRFTRSANTPTLAAAIDKYKTFLRAEGRARKTMQK